MSRAALRVAGYRFRVTFGDRWGGYLALVLLIGLVGGLALGAVAAARRTQAAFPAYLASTNPSDLTVLTGLAGPGSGYDPALVHEIARLPHGGGWRATPGSTWPSWRPARPRSGRCRRRPARPPG